jgi:hypothetical protein
MLFLSAVGDSEAARADTYPCLSEGYRDMTSRPEIEVPELNAFPADLTATAGNDFLEVSTFDLEAYAILDGFNVTQGYEIFPEPGGMTGRNRFLDTTGKPVVGDITNYQRDGTRIYLRNTPRVDSALRFRVRQQVPDVTETMLNESPILPVQYHMKIVLSAAETFFNLHPRKEGDGSAALIFAKQFQSAKLEGLAQVKASPTAEDKGRRESMRLSGYRLSPRSRGRR